jgi:hypothetical protein
MRLNEGNETEYSNPFFLLSLSTAGVFDPDNCCLPGVFPNAKH